MERTKFLDDRPDVKEVSLAKELESRKPRKRSSFLCLSGLFPRIEMSPKVKIQKEAACGAKEGGRE